MFFSTVGLTFGRKSDGGVASGSEGGTEDFFGIVVAVVLGCTTAAFISSPSPSTGAAGI